MSSKTEDKTGAKDLQGDRHKPGHKPLVVVITGPSSAGKSSLVRKLCEFVEGAQAASLDRQLELWLPGHACRTLEEAELLGFSAKHYHERLRELSRMHPLLFCDHVLCGHLPWERDLRERLAAVDLFVVELSCENHVLETRERMRPDREADIQHALWQAKRQADTPCGLSSLRLNSGIHSTEELAAHLLEVLITAFPTSFPAARPTAFRAALRAPIPESPKAHEVLA